MKIKKIIATTLIIAMVTGCSNNKEEREEKLYDSLLKAYEIADVAKGMGFSVDIYDAVEENTKKWYMVSDEKSINLNEINKLVEKVYSKEIATNYGNLINQKYKIINEKLYSTSESGCALKYLQEEKVLEKIKEDITITKNKKKYILFTYDNEEYKAYLNGDYYYFDKELFKCMN